MAISNWFELGKKVVENFRKVPASPRKSVSVPKENPTFRQVGQANPNIDTKVEHSG